jgi:hypothetical protein
MNLEVALKTEIEFWEGMIDLKSGDPDPEILERMNMAKQLAERKLSLYSSECENRNH